MTYTHDSTVRSTVSDAATDDLASSISSVPAVHRLPPKPSIARSPAGLRAGAVGANIPVVPELAVDDSELIREAHRIANQIRDRFKATNVTDDAPPPVLGDGESADAQKHKRRLHLNRKSAANSRMRKSAYVLALEKQLAAIEMDHKLLQAEFQALKAAKVSAGASVGSERCRGSCSPLQRHFIPTGQAPFMSLPSSIAGPSSHPSALPPQHQSPASVTLAVASPSHADTLQVPLLSSNMAGSPLPGEVLAEPLAPSLEEVPLGQLIGDQATIAFNMATEVELPLTQGLPSSALPEPIPDLAEYDPSFFAKLLAEFDSQGLPCQTEAATSEILCFYKSLPE